MPNKGQDKFSDQELFAPVMVEDWGLVPYEDAYRRQKEAVREVLCGGGPRLIICEHPAVLTLGRLASRQHILADAATLGRLSISVIPIDRGGEVTLHAPGQLVAYPVLDLKQYRRDLKWYLHKLEQVAIDFLKDFDILACSIQGRTGVWAGPKKLASIGVGVKQWITYHGIGLNVNTDLSLFDLIHPCGMNVRMTSMRELRKEAIDMPAAKRRFAACFLRHFGGIT
jgi:lipoate-protein ligase B